MYEEFRKLFWPDYDEDVKRATEATEKAAKKAAAKVSVETVMKRFGHSLTKACEIVGISVEEYEKLKAFEKELESVATADNG